MSETPEAHEPADEIEVDLAAFLPEGTELAPIEVAAEAEGEVDAEVEVDAGPGVEDQAEAGPTQPPVDVAVLERIEAELAAVDAALVAIDAGEPGRSALLAELLGEVPPAGDAPPA